MSYYELKPDSNWLFLARKELNDLNHEQIAQRFKEEVAQAGRELDPEYFTYSDGTPCIYLRGEYKKEEDGTLTEWHEDLFGVVILPKEQVRRKTKS